MVKTDATVSFNTAATLTVFGLNDLGEHYTIHDQVTATPAIDGEITFPPATIGEGRNIIESGMTYFVGPPLEFCDLHEHEIEVTVTSNPTSR